MTLGQLTEMVIEGALEGEMDDDLGYGRHAPAERDGGNSRSWHRDKMVLTDVGNAPAQGSERVRPLPDRTDPASSETLVC